MLGVVDCIADCVWLAALPATEWQHIGNQIDVALVAARPNLVKVQTASTL